MKSLPSKITLTYISVFAAKHTAFRIPAASYFSLLFGVQKGEIHSIIPTHYWDNPIIFKILMSAKSVL